MFRDTKNIGTTENAKQSWSVEAQGCAAMSFMHIEARDGALDSTLYLDLTRHTEREYRCSVSLQHTADQTRAENGRW